MDRWRRVAAAGAVVVIALAAVVITISLRQDDTVDLDMTLGAPTVVEYSSSSSPVDLIESALGTADDILELGPLAFEPGSPVTASLEAQPPARTGAKGRVPTWFPVLDGARHVRLVTTGSAEGSADHASYTATRTSLVATASTADDVAGELRDVLDDVWPEIDDTDYETSAGVRSQFEARADRVDGDGYNSLEIATADSDAVPGIVLVEVTASYAAPGRLQNPPQSLSDPADDVIAIASTSRWSLGSWSVTSGVDAGATPWTETRLQWTAGAAEPATVADEVVAQLGLPSDGDVDDDSAFLDYPGGGLWIDVEDGTTAITFSSNVLSWNGVIEPGPVTRTGHGVPLLTVDVDSSRPVDAGPAARPALDAIAEYQQAGMIAIDGAVTVDFSSSVDAQDLYGQRGALYRHSADQLALVDTPLSPREVADRIESSLAELGIELTGTTATYHVDGPSVGFEAGNLGGDGQPWYQIEVGTDDDHPGVVAVRMNVMVRLRGPAPPAPELADAYFAEPAAAGEAEGWELTRWYVVQGRAIRGGVIFRGELDWVTSIRGPDGLEAAVDTLTEISGVEADEIGDDLYWFEDDDDWAVDLMRGHTYEPVTVSWEGGATEVG